MEKVIDVGLGQGYRDKDISIYFSKGKGVNGMELFAMYMENLPSPNYKTKQFTRSIKETVPDDISKEDLMKRAARQEALVEGLVKNDIARHIEEATKPD